MSEDWVYVIQRGSHIKIGTSTNPKERLVDVLHRGSHAKPYPRTAISRAVLFASVRRRPRVQNKRITAGQGMHSRVHKRRPDIQPDP